MASIALAELRTHAKTKSHEAIREPQLVQAIVERFILSNGLRELNEDHTLRQMVAACALAVHLFSDEDKFQVKVPEASADVALWANEMKFFEFSSKATDINQLVIRYGLLEPSTQIKHHERGQHISPPLKMFIPQQLVAVLMLGLDCKSMLQPSWFGFELMSTHFVKCALAASAAVIVSKRPSVKDTLSCLGFQLDNFATGETIANLWNGLGDWNAVFASAESLSQYHIRTQQLDAGLRLHTGNGGVQLLEIDKRLRGAIVDNLCGNEKTGVVPPIACINRGNSEPCDGIVTFFANKRGVKAMPKKISILIRAKDYHENSTVDATRMHIHAAKHNNEALNGVFGETRLFCVASTTKALIAMKPLTRKREYLPFIVEDGRLLTTILQKLKLQRNEKIQVVKCACLCNKIGKIVEECVDEIHQGSSRKRKAIA
jgi:hypothetical protein